MKQNELEKVIRFFAETDENGVSNAEKIPGGFDEAHPENCEGLIFDEQGRFIGMGIDIQNENIYPIEKFKLYYQGLRLVGNADMSGCSDMVFFYLYHNRLTRANLRGMTAMRVLGLQGNQLTELDVSELHNVQGIDVGKNRITALDVTHNLELVEFYVHENELGAVDITKNEKLKYIWCFQNHITRLDATHNPLLKHMDCTDNPLTEFRGFAPDSNGEKPLNVRTEKGGYIGVKYCPVYDAKWKETGEWHQLLLAYPHEGHRFLRWEDENGNELSTSVIWEMQYGKSLEAVAVFE